MEDFDEVDDFDDLAPELPEPIGWTPELALGMDAVDADHRTLIETYNAIATEGLAADPIRLAALLERLRTLTAAHFDDEEKLMRDAGYERFEAHRAEHLKLLDELDTQIGEWQEKQISAGELATFMYRWLLGHIGSTDRPMAAALQQSDGDAA